jgi:hypothetical protein
LDLVLQQLVKVTRRITIHTHECLYSERFNNLGDVFELDVFPQGVLLQMF